MAVYEIKVSPGAGRVVVAFTHGRGVFRLTRTTAHPTELDPATDDTR